MTACILLLQLATTIHAQVRESILSSKRDSVILREGNVNYLRQSVGDYLPGRLSNTFERVDTKDLRGKSYENIYWINTREHQKIMFDVVRSVFSKERAKQLEGMRITCVLYVSPAENNKITHIRFHIRGNITETFPLQLSELSELERRIKAEPKFMPPFEASGKIVDKMEMWSLPIHFNLIY